MDPETERHFAALIMEEAARLKKQAEKEGVHAYLAKPKVRGKPNPQFLKATVRSIEQANRAAEVSGMWKRRARELELEERERKKGRYKHRSDSNGRHPGGSSHSHRSWSKSAVMESTIGHRESNELAHSPRSQSYDAANCTLNESCSSLAHGGEEDYSHDFEDDFADDGLKEEEIEHFLQSRVKRGRGAVGSRMDETGPYPSVQCDVEDMSNIRVKEEWEQRIIGPSREVFERQLAMESKKHTKSKLKADEAESFEHAPKRKSKKEEKKSKRKHRHSHKKSKKSDDL